MKVVEVDAQNVADAGCIHAESWKDSHREICSAAFIAKHTPEAQTAYLQREMAAGKRVFMLLNPHPVGIVSVQESLIENLYVSPVEQRRGYGTRLLHFAIEQCVGRPTLWILNTNEGARRLYLRNGFTETGKRKQLNDQLYEIELAGAVPSGSGFSS